MICTICSVNEDFSFHIGQYTQQRNFEESLETYVSNYNGFNYDVEKLMSYYQEKKRNKKRFISKNPNYRGIAMHTLGPSYSEYYSSNPMLGGIIVNTDVSLGKGLYTIWCVYIDYSIQLDQYHSDSPYDALLKFGSYNWGITTNLLPDIIKNNISTGLTGVYTIEQKVLDGVTDKEGNKVMNVCLIKTKDSIL